MMQGTMRRKAWSAGWAVALLAGLLLRVLFVLHHPRFSGDPLVYGDIAHNLLKHHVYGLTEDHVRSTLIRLPGYPLFLAGCFAVFGDGNYMAVLWVQVVADLCGCALLGRLAARLLGERTGLAAVWLGALCPFTANYAAAALAETLSLLCVVVTLYALARWCSGLRAGRSAKGWAVVVGCGLTGATLLRPDGVLLAGAVVPAMLWVAYRCQQQVPCGDESKKGKGEAQIPFREDNRPCAPFGAGNEERRARVRRSLVQGPILAAAVLCGALGLWALRNWRVLHVFQPLAPKYANDPGEDAPLGFARWYRTWAIGFDDSVKVYWTYDDLPLKLADLPPRAFDNLAQRERMARLYAEYNDLSSATPQIDAQFGALAAERIRANPLRYYMGLPLAKLADMWLRPRTELMKLPVDWWNVSLHPRRSAFEMAYAGLNVVLLALAVMGLVRWRRRGWGGDGPVVGAAVVFVLLRCVLLLTIDNSEPRYTLECYPVVLLLASAAVAGGGRRAKEPVSGGSRERSQTNARG